MDVTDVKRATVAAAEFLEAIYGAEISRGAMLEEVELDDAGFWLITLSLPVRPARPADTSSGLFGPLAALASPRRDYKVFKVDRSSGEVVSMKIRPRPEAA